MRSFYSQNLLIITGPHTQCRRASIVLLTGICSHCLSGFVTLHSRPAGGFTCTGQVMMSCRLQSNYSSTATLHGGPLMLRPVRATPCFDWFVSYVC